MKKLYYLSLSMLSLGYATLSVAQSSGVRFEAVNEPGVEKNGQTIYANGTAEQVGLYLIMKNVSGQTQEYKWERVRESLSNPNASDELCDNWQCYTPSIAGDDWVLGNFISLNANQQTAFEPKLTFPEGSGGNATFHYYVLNSNDQRIDSLTIVFSSTLSVPNNMSSVHDVKVFPNPSSGLITVKDAPVGSTVEITDMVGKMVYRTKINGANQTLDLSANPDGVYFYTVKPADGGKSITKKLVLRH